MAKHTSERLKPLLEQLVDRVTRERTSLLAQLATTMARFPNYSPANLVLILTQNPKASDVRGYKAWQALGRQVRRGEKALRIWAPIRRRETRTDPLTGEEVDVQVIRGFRLVSVFDVEQTDPIPGKEDLYKPPHHDARAPKLDRALHLDAAVAAVSKRIAPVRFERPTLLERGARGYYSLDRHEIILIEGNPPESQFMTLLHEAAHALLHAGSDLGDRRMMELEAESTAFLAASLLGIDAGERAATYLAGWAPEPERIYESLSRVTKAAREIYDTVKAALEASAPPTEATGVHPEKETDDLPLPAPALPPKTHPAAPAA